MSRFSPHSAAPGRHCAPFSIDCLRLFSPLLSFSFVAVGSQAQSELSERAQKELESLPPSAQKL